MEASCRSCHGQIDANCRFCTHCGASTKALCVCGAEVTTMKFCPSCGEATGKKQQQHVRESIQDTIRRERQERGQLRAKAQELAAKKRAMADARFEQAFGPLPNHALTTQAPHYPSTPVPTSNSTSSHYPTSSASHNSTSKASHYPINAASNLASKAASHYTSNAASHLPSNAASQYVKNAASHYATSAASHYATNAASQHSKARNYLASTSPSCPATSPASNYSAPSQNIKSHNGVASQGYDAKTPALNSLNSQPNGARREADCGIPMNESNGEYPRVNIASRWPPQSLQPSQVAPSAFEQVPSTIPQSIPSIPEIPKPVKNQVPRFIPPEEGHGHVYTVTQTVTRSVTYTQ
ncbi:hypothetical protein THRCLA_20404 [Thraustotheca clavata]|uniref:DZANK-type domain-containing protein n=1 Tax=Thraustotheca clavata TaxID=74557 RepID=A0A1W0A7P5_9STRA|nr:hypothetical protein THRCLA_20404 [Thraustotheca clavata]